MRAERLPAPGPIQIGKTWVAPGERSTIDLPLARLYTHTEVRLPVHVVHGRRAGPRLFLTAAVHGDELNGVEIVRRLLKKKSLSRLRGTLIVVPIVNVYAFLARTRQSPDGRDLNRSFPGSKNGSLTSHLARLLLDEVVSKATHGIDLHTGSSDRTNWPQIRANLDDPETAKLAAAFGAPISMHSSTRDGSLREAVRRKGIPVLLFEAGEALRFDETSIRIGVRGILGVMRALGMIEGESKDDRTAPWRSRKSTWVRAPLSGVFRVDAELGARVAKGDCLGLVADPLGGLERPVLSPVAGFVIGRTQLPLVHRGDALMHVATVEGGGP